MNHSYNESLQELIIIKKQKRVTSVNVQNNLYTATSVDINEDGS